MMCRGWSVAMAVWFGVWSGSAADARAGAKPKPASIVLKVEIKPDAAAKDLKKLEAAVKKVKGVVSAKLNKKKGELTVKHQEVATLEQIKEAVSTSGFTLIEEPPAAEPTAPTPAPVEEGAAPAPAPTAAPAPAPAAGQPAAKP